MSTSNLNLTSFELSPRTYVRGKTEKTNVVIHGSFSRTKYSFTASQNSETCLMDNWNIMSDKYAGHYVVGREGKIYNCIPEEYWTNHLGGHKKFSDLNKSTIAIFLCNELYLEKENSKFYAFGFNKPHNLYKGKVFEQAFMNYNHWADYDEAQIDALAVLLNDVCTRQKISKTFYKNSTKYRPNAFERTGILFCANVNDRSYSLPLPSWAANRLETHGLSPTE